jgi:Protein of unknown function (DUF2911)
MKKIVTSFLFAGIAIAATAQVKFPAPSPTQTIKQDFGLGNIELTYSRPVAKGRKVFGDLVPFNELWRTGANGATILKLNDSYEIGGKLLDTGSYALYTIPNADSWTVILNKGIKNWGVDGYTESADVVRFNVTPMKTKTKIESFTMQFAEVKPQTCELHIMWEKTAIAIPIKANITDRIEASINKAMETEKKPYWQATQFYNEYKNNPTKALEFATEAVKANDKAFWIWLYKAKLENTLGQKDAAKASVTKSIDEATKADNKDYVKMGKELLRKL